MDADIRKQLNILGYQATSEIYTSGSTHVYQGLVTADHSLIAIKLLKSLSDHAYEKAYVECNNQIHFAYHSRVVQVINSFGIKSIGQELWSFVIVLEWFEKDLQKEVTFRKTNGNPWREEELMLFARDLVDTLAELQENCLSHRDLKPQNIFCSSDGCVKIGDFGSAKVEDIIEIHRKTLAQTVTGTPFYMSPELKLALTADLSTIEYNPYKSDVYSLGMTLLYCYQLNPPYNLLNLGMLQDSTNVIIQAVTFPMLRELLQLMLAIDVESRPDFVQLRDHLNSECKQPRCLHLPTHRQGYQFPCHGFYCENCTFRDGIEREDAIVRVLCPVCSHEWEYLLPPDPGPPPDLAEHIDQLADQTRSMLSPSEDLKAIALEVESSMPLSERDPKAGNKLPTSRLATQNGEDTERKIRLQATYSKGNTQDIKLQNGDETERLERPQKQPNPWSACWHAICRAGRRKKGSKQ